MKTIYSFILFLALGTSCLQAQDVPITQLKEVVVADSRLQKFSDGHQKTELKDSILKKNDPLLANVLGFNTPIYFKQNGYGMVASPSFRGTNASHTAVVWNGINVNSPLNGQIDFNTINALNYDAITVKSGGASAQYGTGAIGGSVHLGNELRFNAKTHTKLFAGYGSFNTLNTSAKHHLSSDKWAFSLAVNQLQSDNDYKYLNTNQINENGAFSHTGINMNVAHRLRENQILKIYHQTQLGEREFSGTLTAPSRSKYKDLNLKTQLHLHWKHQKATSQIRLVHLFEKYKYFENKQSDFFSFGQVNTLLARYEWEKNISQKWTLNSFLEATHLVGEGSSIEKPNRSNGGGTFLVKYKNLDRLNVTLQARKDFNSEFSSPLIFGTNGEWQISNNYALRWNASRNYNLPTFNDLYWQPGGNLELIPENSYQIDIGNALDFNNLETALHGFLIKTKDMIRWLPNSNGIWSPVNEDSVTIYGLEYKLNYAAAFFQKLQFSSSLNYSFTRSIDDTTDLQLFYVPKHRGNVNIDFYYGGVRFSYQQLYNGAVRVIGNELEDYTVANASLSIPLVNKKSLQTTLGIRVQNLYNTYYENVAFRPMPNRNYNFLLTLNF
ncbi:TonB-dependent receptor plug domain-containing protein [Croceivirga sp. JEA036]|uniref:TonB-dependent receptor plug domain-containing protein n=1 Tax=Croceivirga sp. JEA036 TaxID=2721162 RepID=UPI00143A7173|nr:TonB-dependent receptor [Croceivirga sp. JEA036]NJB37925.1 TonB-dependent receptor [Croceivirga sp. JEA036]